MGSKTHFPAAHTAPPPAGSRAEPCRRRATGSARSERACACRKKDDSSGATMSRLPTARNESRSPSAANQPFWRWDASNPWITLSPSFRPMSEGSAAKHLDDQGLPEGPGSATPEGGPDASGPGIHGGRPTALSACQQSRGLDYGAVVVPRPISPTSSGAWTSKAYNFLLFAETGLLP